MTILTELEGAAALVYAVMPPTPQIEWPLLAARTGAQVWVKHENHSPVGAFKVRGGLVYLAELRGAQPDLSRIVTATRGNHGQSVAFAARRLGFEATIVVPFGNSPEKNAAMRALGARLIEHGTDFQSAAEHARELASSEQAHMIPSFHVTLVRGVASCGLEFLRALPALETVYVPIGMGSGACAMVLARDALGARTRVVGVVADRAPAYALSFERREVVATATAETMADGVACRVPDPDALAILLRGLDRVVRVSEDEIAAAMGHYFTDTHNVAEGAGAAPLAALLKEHEVMRGRVVGLVLTGGNVDREQFARVLSADRTGDA
jgi:threonine dehydratase